MAGLSLAAGIYEGVAYWHGVESSERLMDLNGVLCVLFLALWIDADSRTQPRIYRPFEYGWLVLFYWVLYASYYFWRTRGLKGLLMFAGVICLLLSGWITQWIIEIAR